jgi:hypothetical protein
MLGFGKIKKKAVFTDVATGKQHGFMFSTYGDGKKTFSKGRKF